MKECCEGNLGDLETPNPETPDLSVRVCRVCGARHFVLTVDPLALGIEAKELG